MLITGVLCLGVALLSGGRGLWWLLHSRTHSNTTEVARLAPLRAMAPAQLAAAVMLVAAGLVALVGSSDTAVVIVVICIGGAVGTLAAGSWQSARFAVRRETVVGDCGNACASCTLSCGRAEPEPIKP